MDEQQRRDDQIAALHAELAELAEQNHRLLKALDNARQRRIHVLPADGDGACRLCFTGQYNAISAHAWLEVRTDGTTLRIDNVPVVECDTCGHSLLTIEGAERLSQLLGSAERTEPLPSPLVHLDWLHRDGG